MQKNLELTNKLVQQQNENSRIVLSCELEVSKLSNFIEQFTKE